MNSDTIRFLEMLGPADVPIAGAKAAALAELFRAHFNVPPGFVLTTDAYSQVIQALVPAIEARVTEEVIFDPAEIETAANDVRGLIADAAWPDELLLELLGALARLTGESGETSFAARTSLVAQDLSSSFGTGVRRAVLGICGFDGIRDAAALCWGALWTSRSMYYRHRKGLAQTSVALAVLVQPMIRADSAGTILTRTASGEREGIEINSIWGLGAPLAQARAAPDRFVLDRLSLELREKQIEEKLVRLVVGASGALEHEAVPAGLTKVASVTGTQVRSLGELARSVESHFGEPQEIEWAIVADEIYTLQSRPLASRSN